MPSGCRDVAFPVPGSYSAGARTTNLSSRSSDELLAASRDDVEAFAEFYRRHVEQVHGFFQLRVRDPERAADMTAEVFAAALAARRSYRPKKGPATTWLFAIARHKLIDAARHAQHGDRARRKLGMPVRDVAGLDPATTLEPELAAAELLADMPRANARRWRCV